MSRAEQHRRLGPTAAWLRNALLLSLILGARQWYRLAQPMLWAEDGPTFFSDAYRDGLASFVHPWGGYFHGIQRVIVYGISRLPPTWVPFHWLVILNCLAATLLFGLCVSFFVDDAFSHLVPERLDRFSIALCFCFTPGLDEILGNLANLHAVCALFLFLIAIRARDRELTRAEGVFAALCILTVGEGIVLVPLFAFRFWRFRRRDDGWILGGLVASSILLIAVLSLGGGPGPALPQRDPLLVIVGETLLTWIYGLGNWVEIFPWAGFRLTSILGEHAFVWSLLWLAPMVLVARTLKREPERRFEWACWAAYVAQIVFLTLLVRARLGAALFWKHPITPSSHIGRYGFVLAPYAILFWVLLLGRKRMLLRAFALIYLAHGIVGDFFLPSFETANDWAKVDAEIARAWTSGCPHELVITGAPKRWTFVVTMPQRFTTCH